MPNQINFHSFCTFGSLCISRFAHFNYKHTEFILLADDSGLIYVAEMNLSVRISWSNWWQLACWSVDDFITG